MDMEPKEAQQTLTEIQSTMTQAKKAIASGSSSTLLILWGMIWIVGFLCAQFCAPKVVPWCWLILDVVGIGATLIIVLYIKSPVKSPIMKRVFWFWLLLGFYAGFWLTLLKPLDYLEYGAFVTSIPMFAYVVMGLWFEMNFMIWLGLAVTALSAVGLHLVRPYFWLWMAVTGGGSLAGTGFYIRYRWR